MVELFEDKYNKGTWIIRTGLMGTNKVCAGLNERNLRTIYRKITQIMKIPYNKKIDNIYKMDKLCRIKKK